MQDDQKPGLVEKPAFRPFLVPPQDVPEITASSGYDAPRRTFAQGNAAKENAFPRRSPDESGITTPLALAGHVEWLEAEDLIAELFEDQLLLSMKIAGLQRALDASTSQASVTVLEFHIRELANVREALAALLAATDSLRVHRAFLPEAPLAEYLRGAYAWTLAVAQALEKLAVGIHALQPDWVAFQQRVEAARNLHFDELAEEIREDMSSLLEAGDDASVSSLAAAFEGLLGSARQLEAQLDFHR